MEDYAAKMQLKSDAALREYVTGHAQYREAAVLAALDELRRRGLPAPEEPELRPQLEATVQLERAAAAQPPAEAAPDKPLPELYSPAGIIVMSTVISVLAGGVLLALNLFKVKRGRAVLGLVAFVLAYLFIESLTLRWLLAQRSLTPMTAFLLDLPLILAYVWWFWPRYIGTYQFQPRNWLLPLGVCLLLKFGLLYLLMRNPATVQLIQQQMQQFQQQMPKQP